MKEPKFAEEKEESLPHPEADQEVTTSSFQPALHLHSLITQLRFKGQSRRHEATSSKLPTGHNLLT